MKFSAIGWFVGFLVVVSLLYFALRMMFGNGLSVQFNPLNDTLLLALSFLMSLFLVAEAASFFEKNPGLPQ